MKMLYHYSGNYKCFSILESKSIRMSDIRKSNDYNEMLLFYPKILSYIWSNYVDNPFEFRYVDKTGKDAIKELLDITKIMIDGSFERGYLSNFVACFSEKSDLLSQWRGYADDGKGCCLGFSKKELNNYCEKSNGILRLIKVKYISEKEVDEILNYEANEILDSLKTLRQWIVENMTHDDEDPDTDSLLGYNFHGMIEDLINNSLCFKSKAFSEEKEWRLFLRRYVNKNPDWIVGNNEIGIGPEGFKETVEFLKNKVKFNILENDILPYVSIDLFEFSDRPIKEIWIGPKNIMQESDLKLFLSMYGYKNVKIKYSESSYC